MPKARWRRGERSSLQPRPRLIDKGNYRHFMAKEIHEQPEVVARALAHFLDMSAGRAALPFAPPVDLLLFSA